MSGVRLLQLFKRFMKIHQNPRILYFGFKIDECYIYTQMRLIHVHVFQLSFNRSFNSLSVIVSVWHK